MKNRKTAKLLIMVLSLALLIGSAVGIAASAENAAPEIISQNVEYSGTLNFKFAISAENLGADKTVTVNIYDKNPDEDGAVLLDTTTAEYKDVSDTNLGVDYAYVATSKAAISALNYGTEYYAQAVCDDVAGEAVKYSAVEYFLTRLYREGEVVTDIQREHYENVLAYGSTTQKVTGDTGTNVADFVFVAAEDGKVNGKDSVVVEKGTEVTLSYEGADSGFAYYLDAAGNKLGSTAAVSTSGTYTAKFADFAFNDLSNDTVITLSTSSGFQKASSWADGDKDVSKYAGLVYSYVPSSGRDRSFSIEDGKLKFSTTTGGVEAGIYNASNVESGANYSNFESEMTIEIPETSTQAVITLQLRNGTGDERFRVIFTYKNNGKLYIKHQIHKYFSSSYYTLSDTAVQVANDGATKATFDLKLEMSYIAGATDAECDTALATYINGNCVLIADTRAYTGDLTSAPAATTDVNYYKNTDGVMVYPLGHMAANNTTALVRSGVFRMIYLNPNSGHPCNIYFDNIIYEAKALSAEEIPVYNLNKPAEN